MRNWRGKREEGWKKKRLLVIARWPTLLVGQTNVMTYVTTSHQTEKTEAKSQEREITYVIDRVSMER